MIAKFEISEKDIARVTKKLDQYQGGPLAQRTLKALQAALKLLIAPIRAGAARHHVTGETERTVKVRKLRNRPGEIAAYKVGVTTWYGHFPITGVYGSRPDPYVDRAINAYSGQIIALVDAQITRLA